VFAKGTDKVYPPPKLRMQLGQYHYADFRSTNQRTEQKLDQLAQWIRKQTKEERTETEEVKEKESSNKKLKTSK